MRQEAAHCSHKFKFGGATVRPHFKASILKIELALEKMAETMQVKKLADTAVMPVRGSKHAAGKIYVDLISILDV